MCDVNLDTAEAGGGRGLSAQESPRNKLIFCEGEAIRWAQGTDKSSGNVGQNGGWKLKKDCRWLLRLGIGRRSGGKG